MRYVLRPPHCFFLFVFISVLVLSGCSSSQTSLSSLKIALPSTQAPNSSGRVSARSSQSTTTNYTLAPTSLSDIDCYAINVIGPAIPPDTSHFCANPSDQLGVGGGWISAHAALPEIDLDVPAGPQRTIQLLGVRSPNGCPQIGDFTSMPLGNVYILGTATVDLYQDTTVSIRPMIDSHLALALTSCRTAPPLTASLLNTSSGTYYVSADTTSSITLPLITDWTSGGTAQLTGSTITTSLGNTVTIDAGNQTATYQFSPTNSPLNAVDLFNYTLIDANGIPSSSSVTIKRIYSYTWTGSTSNSWTTASNWCGLPDLHTGACAGATTAPNLTSTVTFVFNGGCSTYCSSTAPSAVSAGTLFLDSTFSGTLSMGAYNLSTSSAEGLILNGGTLNGGTGNSWSISALSIAGGTFNAPTGTLAVNGPVNFSSGGFTQSAGTFVINHQDGVLAYLGSMVFNHLSIQTAGVSGTLNIMGAPTVQGNLILLGICSAGTSTLNGGSITVNGNLSVPASCYGYVGTTLIDLQGSNATISDGGGAHYPGSINANESSTLSLGNQSPLTITSLNAPSVSFTGSGALTLTTANMASLSVNSTTGSLTLGTSTITGSLTYTSAAAFTLAGNVIAGGAALSIAPAMNLSLLGNSLSALSLTLGAGSSVTLGGGALTVNGTTVSTGSYSGGTIN